MRLFHTLGFRRCYGSLQNRLLLGVALAWLFIVALVLGITWQLGKEMVQETNISHLRYESRLLADEITQQVSIRIKTLERLSLLFSQRINPNWLQMELRHHDTLLELFEGLVVSDASGRLIADWPVVPGRANLETGQQEYFRMLRSTGRPYVSQPFVGQASKIPMVLISVPRKGPEGEFQGFVGGVVSLNRGGLFDRLARLRLGERGYASVATATGKILYHPDRDLIMQDVPSASKNPLLDLALDGWQGDGVGVLLNGERGLQSFSQVWPADWVVGLFLPMEQAQLPLQEFIRQLWWVWLSLAILMLPLLWVLLRQMLLPLHHLEEQIGEVGLGRRRKVNLDTNMFELREVSNTFNRVEDERQALLTSLHEREAFLDSILSSTPQGMFVANLDGDITYMNPALLKMLGIEAGAQPSDWLKQVHPDDRPGAVDMWRHSLRSGSEFLRQLRFHRSDNEMLWLEVHARAVLLTQGGHSLGLVGMVKDITERRQQEAIQRWEAEHDPLTGLLNRRGFERRLEEAFADFQKTNTPSALILFDLDHFKPINDEGGHALGDEMLRRIAQVVAWEVRRSDHVARQGGDEFGVLLPSCTLHQAKIIADSLRKAVAEISVIQESKDGTASKEYKVTLSLGVTTFSEDDTAIDVAMERADSASYEAKNLGRNSVVVKVANATGNHEDLITLFD
ncbi:sensor domain-containing diguanylate cyclase [Vreelandella zhuhanensis]|uniref:sensor domain-containing diguanylate cyclase n=1 Tax=Vreelandella zhuhanensis TaxID=2684210 RepID=UPI0035303AC4